MVIALKYVNSDNYLYLHSLKCKLFSIYMTYLYSLPLYELITIVYRKVIVIKGYIDIFKYRTGVKSVDIIADRVQKV